MEKVNKESTKLKIDVLTPLRGGGPRKVGENLVRVLNNKKAIVRDVHTFLGVIKRFFYTDADIIHSTLPLFISFQKKPIIIGVHGDFRREKNIWKFFYPSAIKNATKIVTPSNFLKKELKLKNATIIPNGINIEKYNSVNYGNNKIIKLVIITGFSFWDKARGVLELLKILDGVKTKIKQDFELIIVGGGHYLTKIQKQSKKYDLQVNFVGHQENTQKFLNEADIFVYYSFFDNLPNAVIEAMAKGLPVVSNNVGGVGEIINSNKVGFIANTPKQYELSLISLINTASLRKKLGTNAREHIKNKFNWDKLAIKYLEVFKSTNVK